MKRHGLGLELFFLGIILVVALTLRLYRITNPIADWHSFRQADTASVTREFLKHGIVPWMPTYHDLSNIQSGKDNPHGYRMVEFPILSTVTALLIKTLQLEKYEVFVGRLVVVAYSLVALGALYALVRQWSGRLAATGAAVAFAILPYSVYYSRAILPEMPFVACLSVALAAMTYAVRKNNVVFFWIAVFSYAESMLHKPYGVFAAPLFALIFLQSWGLQSLKKWQPYIFGVLALTPLLVWRWWILKFPEGIPASDWLFNKENIRFSGAFFHWIFEVRLSNLILGIGMVVPAIYGLLRKGKDVLFYWVWTVCLLAYAWIFAGGNVQHDYYQVFFIPLLCALIGRGVAGLNALYPKHVARPVLVVGITALTVFSLFVSWYTIRGYFNINHWEIVEAGKAADALLPPDAKVIAPYMGDTAFLFQINRTGWPIGFEIDDKIKKGAQYYVSVNYDDETNDLIKKYVVMERTPQYVIIDLQKKRK